MPISHLSWGHISRSHLCQGYFVPIMKRVRNFEHVEGRATARQSFRFFSCLSIRMSRKTLTSTPRQNSQYIWTPTCWPITRSSHATSWSWIRAGPILASSWCKTLCARRFRTQISSQSSFLTLSRLGSQFNRWWQSSRISWGCSWLITVWSTTTTRRAPPPPWAWTMCSTVCILHHTASRRQSGLAGWSACLRGLTHLCIFVRKSSLQTRTTRRWTSSARNSTARRQWLCGPTAPRHQLIPTIQDQTGSWWLVGCWAGVLMSWSSWTVAASEANSWSRELRGRERRRSWNWNQSWQTFISSSHQITGLDDDCREENGEGQGADLPDHRDVLQQESKRGGAACA